MSILSVPRIESLESQSIRVVPHGPKGAVKEAPWSFTVYPFDTIQSIKQRIALHWASATGTKPVTIRKWLPAHQFVAVKGAKEGMWRTLEFLWPFDKYLADPLAVHGQPDGRLMEDGIRKPVFPTLLGGITVESMDVKSKKGEVVEIHVWSLVDLAEGLDIDAAVLGGYIQLYFPAVGKVGDIVAAQQGVPLTGAEKETLETYTAFHEQRMARLQAVEGRIGSLKGVAGPSLRDLRVLRYALQGDEESLEILFYKTTPSRACPFLRYFAGQTRTPPLLKLATGPSGIPLITDTRLLQHMLTEAPSANMGAVLLFKMPIQGAPLGTTWTLRMFEGGRGELVLAAPRRDAPLSAAMVEVAFRGLPAFLEATPWKSLAKKGLDAATMVEFTGSYEYTIGQTDVSKPTRGELQRRSAAFQPLFVADAPITGDSAALQLRWKAVSNFTGEEGDPVLRYITALFLKESSKTVDSLPVEAYVGALAREFGLGPAEGAEAMSTWIKRHAEYVITDPDAPEKATSAHNMGAGVSVYNYHPRYVFQVASVAHFVDLQRLLTALEVWMSHTSAELIPAAAAAAEVTEVVEIAEEPLADVAAEPEVDAEQAEAWMMAMDMYGMYGQAEEGADVGDVGEANAVERVQNATTLAPPAAVVEPTGPVNVRLPEKLKADEPPLPSTKEFFLSQLKQHNLPLFHYQAGDKGYSRSCQNNVNKQPNVMTADAYKRIRALYGNRVHWLESPLSDRDADAVMVASKMVGERMKLTKEMGRTPESLLAAEKRALELGFPLKGDKSIITVWPGGADKAGEMAAAFKHQASKSLWIVVRAGSSGDKPNYYICAEYWCVRDDLPILDEEFRKTEACPFCGGKLIQVRDKPKAGETVIKRGPSTPSGGPVAKYAGYLKSLFHPNQFALPCCFVDPNNMLPPAGSVEIPQGRVPLPTIQREEVVEEAVEEAPAAAVADTSSSLMYVFGDSTFKMDYVPAVHRFLTENPKAAEKYRFLNKEKTKIEVSAKKVLRAYILESTSFPLETGKVGLLPAAVDAFLGQDRKVYLESLKHGKIYTHPELSATAFFRLGLGMKPHKPGVMLLQLIAFAKAAVSQVLPVQPVKPYTNEEVLADMFDIQEVAMFHAWQQANYGTLPLEFAAPQKVIHDGDFQGWCQRVGLPLPDQRAHAESLYRAWLNFQDYVRDLTASKDLALWEHLFATPGLFTTTGVLLATIVQTADGGIQIRCPTLGVPPRSQQLPQPIMLLYEDPRTRLCEPLVFFQGPDVLLGVLYPGPGSLGLLHSNIREPLWAFYEAYKKPRLGCGRPRPPPHPWRAEVRQQATLVRLGDLLAFLKSQDIAVHSLLRDRTRRLVGIRVHMASGGGVGDTLAFLPAVDDGTVAVEYPSVYDVDALPRPPLGALMSLLEPLVKKFTELTPTVALTQRVGEQTMRVAIQTRGGYVLPCKPTPLDAVVQSPLFLAIKKTVDVGGPLPWEYDLATLGILDDLSDAERASAIPLIQNPEEVFTEALEHLQLTLSNWLATPSGQHIREQILGLLSARQRFPLWELQKRMDILLYPLVRKWVHVGTPDLTKERGGLLRRDCLAIEAAGECGGACAWNQGTCKIHVTPTARYVDPVDVLVARLGDVLLRSHGEARHILERKVPLLKAPKGIMKDKESLVVAAEGRGDSAFFASLGITDRLPTRYTQGLTIPEGQTEANVGYEATHHGIPLTWEGVEHMAWAAQQSRDPRQQRELFWSAFAGKPWDALKPLFSQGVTAEVLQTMSDQRGTHILTTRDGPSGYALDRWFVPTTATAGVSEKGKRRFLILDPMSGPLMSAQTREPVLDEAELPSAIREWLDQSWATDKDQERHVDEELEEEDVGTRSEDEGDVGTPVAPYTRIVMEKEGEAKLAAAPKPVMAVKPAKPCPEGQERSPASGACVKICKEGLVRDPASGRCVTRKKLGARKPSPKRNNGPRLVIQNVPNTDQPAAAPAAAAAKPCKEGQERSPISKKCVESCKDGQVRDWAVSPRCMKPEVLKKKAPKGEKAKEVKEPKEVQAQPKNEQPKEPLLQGREAKPCKEGKERSPISKDCVEICKDGQVRDWAVSARCMSPKTLEKKRNKQKHDKEEKQNDE